MQTSDGTLISTTPYYIDRKYRPNLTPEPRCLCFYQNNSALECSISENRHFHNKSCSQSSKYKKLRQQPPRAQVQYSITHTQWEKDNTKDFKQQLKHLLEKYYELKENQEKILANKAKMERLKQLQNIQKSLQILLSTKKIFYQKIKQHQMDNRIHSIQERQRQIREKRMAVENYILNSKKKRQQLVQCKTKNSKIFFVEQFAKSYIQRDEVLPEGKVTRQRIHEGIQKFMAQKELGNFNYFHTFSSGSNFKIHQNIHHRDSFSEKANMTMQQFNFCTEENKQRSIQKARQFLSRFKKYKEANSSQNSSQIVSNQIINDKIEQVSIDKRSASRLGEGEDKFYKVIKSLLTKSKANKQKYDLTFKRSVIGNAQKSVIDPLRATNTPTISKMTKQNGQEAKQSEGARLILPKHKTIKQAMQKPSREVLQQKSQNTLKTQYKKGKQKPVTQRPKKLSNNKNGHQKFEKQQKKQNKKKKQKNSWNQKQGLSFDNSSQQIKARNRAHRGGLNYAKLFGKLAKASQTQKISSPKKFRYLKNINTRQTFFKNKHQYVIDQKIFSELKNQISSVQQVRHEKNQIQQTQNQGSNSESSFHSEQKLKLTKYEEARLLYNMRNLKSRQLISTMKNALDQSYKEKQLLSQRQKLRKPSFCNYLPNMQQPPTRAYNKQGSIVRHINQEQQQPICSNQLSIPTYQKLPNSSSKKLFTVNSQTELRDLSNLEEFNLREAKNNITSYLRKAMKNNEKAKQLYDFLMFMEESKKATLQQQEVNSSLDQLQIQKEQEDMKNLVKMLQPEVEDYQGCSKLHENMNYNQKDYQVNRTIIIGKLDARSIQLMYHNNQPNKRFMETLSQCSLKQIREIMS